MFLSGNPVTEYWIANGTILAQEYFKEWLKMGAFLRIRSVNSEKGLAHELLSIL